MMKKLLLIKGLLIILLSQSYSQNWIKHYGDQQNILDDKFFYQAEQMPDGSYKSVGWDNSLDSSVFSFDQFGVMSASEGFDLLSGGDYFNRILKTQSGAILMASTRPSNWSATGWKLGLVKIDLTDNIIWDLVIDSASTVDYGSGGLPNEFCYSSTQNKYFIACSKPINSSNAPIGILAVDTNGSLDFNKELNTPHLGGGGQFIEGILDNGSSVFIAGTGYYTQNLNEAYVYKTDYNGDSVSFKNYRWIDELAGLEQWHNGYFHMFGMDTTGQSFIMLLDANGDSVTTNYYGVNPIVDIEYRTNTTTYAVLSHKKYNNFGDSTWVILRTYNDLNLLLHANEYIEDSSFTDIPNHLTSTNDEGYLITAMRYCDFCGLNSLDQDPFLIKTDSTGKVNNDVWPGDANSDGVANIIDILPIGIGYGAAGPVRTNASLNWVAQPATDFGSTFLNGTDYKHADCNGDGAIDVTDANAILLNYGLTHSKGEHEYPYVLNNPDLYIEISADTTTVSTTFKATIMLGDVLNSADTIYGAAFTMNFDPALVDSSQMSVDYSNSWLGNISNNNDLISIDTTDLINGKLHIGMTRTDQVNKSGFGEICAVDIFTTDNISGKQTLYETLELTISDVKIISLDETEKSVNLLSDSTVIIDPSTVSIEEVASSISGLYPNPAKGQFSINGEFENAEVSISNVAGQIVSVFNAKPSTMIGTKQFRAGVYFVTVKTQYAEEVLKLIIK